MLRAAKGVLSLSVLSLGWLSALPAANAESSISGLWKLSYEVENTTKDYALDLKQDGEKVTGQLVSPRTGRKDELTGTLKDQKLTFEVKRQTNETFAVEATLKSPDRFEGKMTINGEHTTAVVIARPQASPVVGKWNVVTKSPDGNQEYASTLELTEAEGKLAGKSVSQLGTIDIRSPAFAGGKLTYEITLNLQGNDVEFVVTAELKEQNKLAGSWKVRDADLTGDWSASREAAAAPPAPAPTTAPQAKPAEAPAKGLAGTWRGYATAASGEKKSFQLDLTIDGEKVSGKIQTETHGTLELQSGRASGKKLQLSFQVDRDGSKVDIKLEAELDDHEALRGKWTLGDQSGELIARKPLTL